MGKASITEAVAFLADKGLRAARGYPSTLMPQIRGLAIAVVAHKVELLQVTYKAIVCVPRSLGMSACENGAELVSSVWRENGATCTWGNAAYSDVMGAYTIDVYGRWDHPSMEDMEEVTE